MRKKLLYVTLVLLVWGLVAPGRAAELAHRWSFNGDLTDSVGGKDAVIVDLGPNNAILSDTEITLTGGAKASSDYIDLPDGIVSSLGDAVTFEAWATQISVQNWSRIFDFGSSTSHNVFMSWTSGTTLNADRVEWLGPNDSDTRDNTNAPYTLGVEFHIVCVFDNGLVTWYTGPADSPTLGEAKGSFQSTNKLSELNDTNCWLGRSQWEDATANASWNEVRLWKGALTPDEIEKYHRMGPDGINPNVAVAPSPEDGATDVPREVRLGWGAGESAAAHDVYFGTSLADVDAASRSNP
ncbi:MAG TPA: LamG domain-containing protein, partial [Sedimentisphaerales bacterium]|nr:LamG domain-containing protein [Sedimentisphaerales bacterium]HRS12578.1 LamG domain-containing protein [Sedimentisphaerales bacterium]HRV49174.1 LamG domain-containing protein [Sedimentisphaerales bacterium]